MVHQTGDVQAALAGQVQPGAKLYRTREGTPVLLERSVMLTGDFITNANSGIDQQNGSPAVFITLDGQGQRFLPTHRGQSWSSHGNNFYRAQDGARHPQRRNAEKQDGDRGSHQHRHHPFPAGQTISDHRSRLHRRSKKPCLAVEGRGRWPHPSSLSRSVRWVRVWVRTNIDQGRLSVQIAFVLVLLFMAWWYRVFGLVANLALAFKSGLDRRGAFDVSGDADLTWYRGELCSRWVWR